MQWQLWKKIVPVLCLNIATAWLYRTTRVSDINKYYYRLLHNLKFVWIMHDRDSLLALNFYVKQLNTTEHTFMAHVFTTCLSYGYKFCYWIRNYEEKCYTFTNEAGKYRFT